MLTLFTVPATILFPFWANGIKHNKKLRQWREEPAKKRKPPHFKH